MSGQHDAASAAAVLLAGSGAEVLGDAVRSVLVYGSLTMGDFVPCRSDLDVLIVVDRPLSGREIEALVGVVATAELGGASGIDLHVVTANVAAAPTREPPLELHVGRYAGLELEVESHVAASPDLAAELSMARASGRALVGVEAGSVLGTVPAQWVRDRGAYWLEFWAGVTDDARHAELMVLTACRIWHFHRTGRHATKAGAGRWALERDPSLTAVREALRQRHTDPATMVGEDGIRQVLATVRRDIGSPTSA